MKELESITLLGALALPWVAMGLLMAGGPWARGGAQARWMWLIPAAVSGVILWLAGAGWGTVANTVPIFKWIPEQGVGASLLVDGLSLFFGLVVAGMGTLIFLYTAGYFAGKPKEFRQFHTYLLFFMAAMLGTVFSGNLLMLYVMWEMTGLASFFLIGYLHDDKEARDGARMALLTTILTGMCMLAGILLVGMAAGTFEIVELAGRAEGLADSGAFQAGFILILIGAFGKSAQFPFHYWLPNAMSAPTPVSAYLHSATMVKLGVFLIARLLPVFQSLESWAPVLILVGFVTFLIGALFALLSHKLKAILAYSTVSQLGFLVGFYGMTPPDGAHWDLLHIANHVLYKGALFMVVGIIDHSTGIKDIRELGGLRKRLPLLFAITLVCAASMAGVIGTTGFLSKEYMLKEKLDYLMDAAFLNAFPIMVVIIGSTIKVAFSLRLVMHLFFGGESKKAMADFHRPSFLIQLPPLVLAALTVLGGLIPWLSSRALEAFMVSGLHDPDPAPLEIWHGLDSPAFLISCGILLAGYLLFRLFDKTGWRWAVIPKWARFDDGFAWAVDRLPAFGGWISRVLGVEHPRYHAPIVLAVSLVWVGYPLIKMAPHFALPVTTGGDLLLPVLSAALLVCAGVCLVFVNSWKAKVILMGVIGFLMTFYFILYRAPDLALTQILIEVASLLLLLLLILRFPSLRTPPEPLTAFARGINGLISVGVGVLIFTLTLVFSGRPNGAPLGEAYLAASMPLAKGSNAVNTILVDFRGFDTLMEIGVLVIATLGIMGLLLHRNRI